MFQDELDISVGHGHQVGADHCAQHKEDGRLVQVHLMYAPEQPCAQSNKHPG